MDNLVIPKYEPAPNWSSFYRALVRLGPVALKHIPRDWVRWFQEEGAATDWFWSEDIEYCLFSRWGESPELAVLEALARYTESVQAALAEFLYGTSGPGWRSDALSGELIPRSECIASITCAPVRPRIHRALPAAAMQLCEDEQGALVA